MEPIDVQDFLAWKPEEKPVLIGSGVLAVGGHMVIFGQEGSWKSMLALQLAMCLSSGESWLGFEVPPEGVSTLYLQTEVTQVELQKRLAKMWNGWYGQKKKPCLIRSEGYLKLDEPAQMASVDHNLEQHRPEVLIIDPLFQMMSGSMVDDKDVRKLLDSLTLMSHKRNVAVVLITHRRKRGPLGASSDDLYGQAWFKAWPDTIIRVERKGGESDAIDLVFDKVRYASARVRTREVMFRRDDLQLEESHQKPQVSIQAPKSKFR